MTHRIDNLAPVGSLFKEPGKYAHKIKETFRKPRETNDNHLAAIRKCPCIACGEERHVQAAHVRKPSAAHSKRSTGMQEKPDDKWTLPLCADCHDRQHRLGELTFWHQTQLSPFLICERLYAASPNIEAMREIVMNVRVARLLNVSANNNLGDIMDAEMEVQERKNEARSKAEFDKWLDEPMVRLGLSMIPAGENADALRMLLRSAFDAGVKVGSGNMAMSFLEAVLKKPPTDPRR